MKYASILIIIVVLSCSSLSEKEKIDLSKISLVKNKEIKKEDVKVSLDALLNVYKQKLSIK